MTTSRLGVKIICIVWNESLSSISCTIEGLQIELNHQFSLSLLFFSKIFRYCVHQAWKLLKEGRSLELIDEKVRRSSEISQVLRSIQVGLLCVQQCPKDRPDMATAVLMLSSDNIPSLPQPKEPGYFATRIIHHSRDPPSFSTNLTPPSSNSLSITFPGPR